jgi:hypothetical protein
MSKEELTPEPSQPLDSHLMTQILLLDSKSSAHPPTNVLDIRASLYAPTHTSRAELLNESGNETLSGLGSQLMDRKKQFI